MVLYTKPAVKTKTSPKWLQVVVPIHKSGKCLRWCQRQNVALFLKRQPEFMSNYQLNVDSTTFINFNFASKPVFKKKWYDKKQFIWFYCRRFTGGDTSPFPKLKKYGTKSHSGSNTTFHRSLQHNLFWIEYSDFGLKQLKINVESIRKINDFTYVVIYYHRYSLKKQNDPKPSSI